MEHFLAPYHMGTFSGGSWLMKWPEGQTPTAAASLDAGDLIGVLGGLPLGKEHCAQLTVKALRQALQQAQGGAQAAKGDGTHNHQPSND